MLKYADALRRLKDQITDRAFVRPLGEGPEAEAALDLIMETVSILDYDTDYLPGAEFAQVANDTRKLAENSIFVAIAGSRTDGSIFIPQALQKGAKVIISEKNAEDMLLPGTVNLVVKKAGKAYALLCETAEGNPTENMTGFAVTGTNGKTTTAMLIRFLLNKSGNPCGMISTVEYDLGKGNTLEADRTTPEASELFKYFRTMRSAELKNMVMEVSSHALIQDRIGALQFDAAIFTNLTGDHLDYHGNMEEYFQAKKLLFAGHLKKSGNAIVNISDPYGKRLAETIRSESLVTFGSAEAMWNMENICLDANSSCFDLVCGARRQHFTVNLCGLYNVYNVAGAVIALDRTGLITIEKSADILLQNSFAVPGRLEKITISDNVNVFVDYAHTPDALKNVLITLKALAPRRLITVFGCGGDRDKSKRPAMGKAAAELSDTVYLTSDNPRSEEPLSIIREIESGIDKNLKNHLIEPDRKTAVLTALKNALPGDVILIAGKGHENYQEINGIKYPFDDREIVREFAAR